jgi:hypothetical protein
MTNIWSIVLVAMAFVESTHNAAATNVNEQAYGIYQIRQPTLDDVNEYARTNYKLQDFINNVELSEWALFVKGKRYGATTPEEYCRIWNKTSDPWGKKADIYWKKIENEGRRLYRLVYTAAK